MKSKSMWNWTILSNAMKRTIAIALIVLSSSVLFAQKDSVFYKHELRVSYGDALVTSINRLESDKLYSGNFSFIYYFRPEKSIWTGINFVNYFGKITHYHWRKYDSSGSFQDFTKSKNKYCAIIAPEIRLSYVNKNSLIIYCAMSGGIGFENGYDTKKQKYPNIFPCMHLTLFGICINLATEKNNVFFGGELGAGFKGLGSFHVGYRF